MKGSKSIDAGNRGVRTLNAGTIGSIDLRSGRSKPPTDYPAGSIGSNVPERNYVRYLAQRYNEFSLTDAFERSSASRFSYATIFKDIQRMFNAPTYFVPEARFEDLVLFLQGKIDRTILGKRNRARGIRNYDTFEEFRNEQRVVSEST